MAKLIDIQTYLNELLQPSLFSDFCTNGIQIEGKPEVKKICTAVSASNNAINKATEMGADLLLVHHGIFWNRDSYDIVGLTKAKVKPLLVNDITLMAYHLPLDGHKEFGNNFRAAMEMGWTNLQPFPNDKAPYGVKGKFPKKSLDKFCNELSKFYGQKMEIVPGGSDKVSTAILVSGGGHKFIFDAAKEKVDCYITGSRDEPTWRQANELGINFVAAGHYATEVIGVKRLGEHLAEKFKLKCSFIPEANPF